MRLQFAHAYTDPRTLPHDDGIAQRMLDLLDVNSVPKRRQENVHLGIVVQNHPRSQHE
jgi:hypothetical protein